jgi:hypothetical protein
MNVSRTSTRRTEPDNAIRGGTEITATPKPFLATARRKLIMWTSFAVAATAAIILIGGYFVRPAAEPQTAMLGGQSTVPSPTLAASVAPIASQTGPSADTLSLHRGAPDPMRSGEGSTALVASNPAPRETVQTNNTGSGPLVLEEDNATGGGEATEVKHDFGVLDPLETQQIPVHSFRLRNRSDKPVTLGPPQVTCGCTYILLVRQSAPATAATRTSGQSNDNGWERAVLAPGERVELRVGLDAAATGRRDGATEEQVWLYAEKGSAPLIHLRLRARIRPAVAFAPRVLDLGKIRVGTGGDSGSPLRGTLLLYLDIRLTAAFGGLDRLPPLRSSNPAISVSRPEPVPAGAEPPTPPTASAPPAPNPAMPDSSKPDTGYVLARYTVTVAPNAPVGLLYARLTFPVPVGTAGSRGDTTGTGKVKPLTAESAGAYLNRAFITVSARKDGRYRFAEEAVAFGTVARASLAQGKQRREVALLAALPQGHKTAPLTPTTVRLQSSSPWVTATLSRAATAKPPRSGTAGKTGAPKAADATATAAPEIVVHVALHPRTPAGAIDATVTLTLPDGEKHILPVFAFVRDDNVQ